MFRSIFACVFSVYFLRVFSRPISERESVVITLPCTLQARRDAYVKRLTTTYKGQHFSLIILNF